MAAPHAAIIFPVEGFLKSDLVQRDRGLTESRLSSVPTRVTGSSHPRPFGARQLLSMSFLVMQDLIALFPLHTAGSGS